MQQTWQSKLKQHIIQWLWRLESSKRIFEGNAAILMLHRIAPIDSDKLPINEALKVSPEFLESFIKEARESGYSFVSLDELAHNLRDSKPFSKLLCITIDDGYKDNLTYGYPIFESHRVPFCIYVCTSFPESTHNMWWFGLEDYLLAHNSFSNKGGGQYTTLESNPPHSTTESTPIPRTFHTLEQKQELFLALRAQIIANSTSYTDSLAICHKLGISYDPRTYDHLTLTWEDIARIATSPLATIGNHTHTHPIFNRLTPQAITEDITTAQNLFATHDLAPRHFAYPFGSRFEVDSVYFAIPRELGFVSATTTRAGSIYPKHRDFMHALPRFMLTDSFTLRHIYRPRRHKIVVS